MPKAEELCSHTFESWGMKPEPIPPIPGGPQTPDFEITHNCEGIPPLLVEVKHKHSNASETAAYDQAMAQGGEHHRADDMEAKPILRKIVEEAEQQNLSKDPENAYLHGIFIYTSGIQREALAARLEQAITGRQDIMETKIKPCYFFHKAEFIRLPTLDFVLVTYLTAEHSLHVDTFINPYANNHEAAYRLLHPFLQNLVHPTRQEQQGHCYNLNQGENALSEQQKITLLRERYDLSELTSTINMGINTWYVTDPLIT